MENWVENAPWILKIHSFGHVNSNQHKKQSQIGSTSYVVLNVQIRMYVQLNAVISGRGQDLWSSITACNLHTVMWTQTTTTHVVVININIAIAA